MSVWTLYVTFTPPLSFHTQIPFHDVEALVDCMIHSSFERAAASARMILILRKHPIDDFDDDDDDDPSLAPIQSSDRSWNYCCDDDDLCAWKSCCVHPSSLLLDDFRLLT